jgi:hypothetical protein
LILQTIATLSADRQERKQEAALQTEAPPANLDAGPHAVAALPGVGWRRLAGALRARHIRFIVS